MRIDVSYNIYELNNPQKYQKSWKNLKNTLKNWRLCHARHETVTHGSWKTNQFITIKLQRFWHHLDLCNIVEKWSNRDDTHTHRHTDTKFFIALSYSGTSITSRKVIKSGCVKNLFFAWIQCFGILMRAEVKFWNAKKQREIVFCDAKKSCFHCLLKYALIKQFPLVKNEAKSQEHFKIPFKLNTLS
jgi:hypothetical protein